MKKNTYIFVLMFFLIGLIACERNNYEKDLHESYDKAIEQGVIETIEMDGLSVLIKDHVILGAKYGLQQVTSFDLEFQYDSNVFTSEDVTTWGGGNLKLTVKASALKDYSYESKVTCIVTTQDKSYSKTVDKTIIVPSWHYCIGQLYIGNIKNVDFYDNNGKEGFTLRTQTISSGHFYTDYTTELDLVNQEIRYEIKKYEHDTSGSYNFKTNDITYYYLTGEVSINGCARIQVEYLDTSDRTSLQSSAASLVRKFDKLFLELGLTQYVSNLS